MNKKPGWHWKNCLLIAVGAVMVWAPFARAGSHTVREVKLLGNGSVQVHLDGVPPKGSLEFEYVRDIVQLSIQNSTIYPAKILHSDSGEEAFSKVFAYQYAPQLVRIRFTVGGKADAYRGKVKLEQKGKTIMVRFPATLSGAREESSNEQSLLAKVLGQTTAPVKEEPQVIAPARQPSAAEASKASDEADKSEKLDTKPRLTGSKNSAPVQLGGARSGVSPFRSLFAMFLVVGGLGLVLMYVKSKKKGSASIPAVKDSWWTQMLNGAKKNASYIEVLASHALGPKQSITVVRIRDQKFVLGVTQDSVQLITQLDSDETDAGVLEDPQVADSIGKLFGAKPKGMPAAPSASVLSREPAIRIPEPAIDLGASFNSMLKSSTGAGAVVARTAYQENSSPARNPGSGVRNKLRQRVQEMGRI